MIKSKTRQLVQLSALAYIFLHIASTIATVKADLFVSSAFTDSVLRYDEHTGSFLGTFVSPQSGGLDTPSGIVFDRSGNLIVSSNGSDAVKKYDGQNGSFLTTLDPFKVKTPSAALVGPDGDIYVSSFAGAILRYDDATGEYLNTFVTATALGGWPLGGMVFGRDGNLYAAHQSGAVHRFNGTTGAFIDNFISGGPGLAIPTTLTFGPDGNLYVSSYFNNAIYRYNGLTGEFVDLFVPTGTGGLSGPMGILFGPNGDLFVSSANTDSILRYDGQTGEFIGEFVTPGSGGLDRGTYMTFSTTDPTTLAYVPEPSGIVMMGVAVLVTLASRTFSKRNQ